MDKPICLIGVGSNINSAENIYGSINKLGQLNGISLKGVSRVFITEPIDRPEQEDYRNCILAIQTSFGPYDIKRNILLPIETRFGRTRTEDKYAARTIDLDLLAFGDIVNEDMGIPDSEISSRDFLAQGILDLDVCGVAIPENALAPAEAYGKNRSLPVDEVLTERLKKLIEENIDE